MRGITENCSFCVVLWWNLCFISRAFLDTFFKCVIKYVLLFHVVFWVFFSAEPGGPSLPVAAEIDIGEAGANWEDDEIVIDEGITRIYAATL